MCAHVRIHYDQRAQAQPGCSGAWLLDNNAFDVFERKFGFSGWTALGAPAYVSGGLTKPKGIPFEVITA